MLEMIEYDLYRTTDTVLKRTVKKSEQLFTHKSKKWINSFKTTS